MIDNIPLSEWLHILDAEGEEVPLPTEEQLIDKVCDMITMINDPALLE